MVVDRYTKLMLTVIAVALSVLALRSWFPGPGPAQAQTTTPKYQVTLPRSWGKLVGYSNNNLLLEGPDGKLRIVDVEGKAPEYPRVKVLIDWQ